MIFCCTMYLLSTYAFTYVLMKTKAFAVILRSLSVMSRRVSRDLALTIAASIGLTRFCQVASNIF